MRRRLKKKFVIPVGLMAAGLLIYAGLRNSTEGGKDKEVHVVARSRPEIEKKKSIEQRVDEAKGDPKLLFGLLADLGDAKSDGDIQDLYLHALNDFSPEQIAAVIDAWPELRFDIYSMISEDKDSDRFCRVLESLGAKGELKSNLLQIAGKRASYLSPEKIGLTLAKLGPSDLSQLASGITGRIDGVVDGREKVKLIDQYLQQVRGPELVGPLVGARTAQMSIGEATGWLLSLDPAVGAYADSAVMKRIQPSDIQGTTDFLNSLLTSGQTNRAQKDIQFMVAAYSRSDPQAAYNWVASLPPDLVTVQSQVTVFSKLYNADPVAGKQVFASTKDPKLLSLYESAMSGVDDSKRRASER